jgi:hypothetical protein
LGLGFGAMRQIFKELRRLDVYLVKMVPGCQEYVLCGSLYHVMVLFIRHSAGLAQSNVLFPHPVTFQKFAVVRVANTQGRDAAGATSKEIKSECFAGVLSVQTC